MARLRGEGGCDWDRKQTLESFKGCITQEAEEVVEAAESRDREHLKEELGDLLWNILFVCRMAEEEGWFDTGDVLAAIRDKMIRRHPHVFGDVKVESVDEILSNWRAMKDSERSAAGEGR
ncbi:MAG: MazG nucleotide pyrophosphohydrolase domain-containing protein [bacterium]